MALLGECGRTLNIDVRRALGKWKSFSFRQSELSCYDGQCSADGSSWLYVERASTEIIQFADAASAACKQAIASCCFHDDAALILYRDRAFHYTSARMKPFLCEWWTMSEWVDQCLLIVNVKRETDVECMYGIKSTRQSLWNNAITARTFLCPNKKTALF